MYVQWCNPHILLTIVDDFKFAKCRVRLMHGENSLCEGLTAKFPITVIGASKVHEMKRVCLLKFNWSAV